MPDGERPEKVIKSYNETGVWFEGQKVTRFHNPDGNQIEVGTSV